MIGNDVIERVNSFKLLGVWIQDNFKWNTHIEEFTKKANKRLFYLSLRILGLPSESLLPDAATRQLCHSGV